MNKNSPFQVSIFSLLLVVLAFALGFTFNGLVREYDGPISGIEIGDVLLIKSAAEKLIDSQVVVLSDKSIDLTLIGNVSVDGKSMAELTECLNNKYSHFLGEDPAITVFRQAK